MVNLPRMRAACSHPEISGWTTCFPNGGDGWRWVAGAAEGLCSGPGVQVRHQGRVRGQRLTFPPPSPRAILSCSRKVAAPSEFKKIKKIRNTGTDSHFLEELSLLNVCPPVCCCPAAHPTAAQRPLVPLTGHQERDQCPPSPTQTVT